MKKQIIAGVFAGALSVGGAAAQENSTNHLEAANGNIAETTGQSLQSQEYFAKNILAQILARSGDKSLQYQEAEIKSFCDNFNAHVVEPLIAMSQNIDIQAEYKEDVIIHSSRGFTGDACVVTVNGEEVNKYTSHQVMVTDNPGFSPTFGRSGATYVAERVASSTLNALNASQLRQIAIKGDDLLEGLAVINWRELPPQEYFAKNILAQIVERSGGKAIEQQDNAIQRFCGIFNEQVVAPLKSISPSIDIKAEYNEDVMTLPSNTLFSKDACVITVNGEKIDTYSYSDILRDELATVVPGGIGAQLRVSGIASRALNALDGIQLRAVARRADGLLAELGVSTENPAPIF